MILNTKIYRLMWQSAGFPEHEVFGGYEDLKIVEGLLKSRHQPHKLELKAEATSDRLPAPEPEVIETVDQEPRSRQGRRHAASQTAETDSDERDDGIDSYAMRRLARRALYSRTDEE